MSDPPSQIGQYGGMAILVACLRTGDPQTYENATGALWNVGLDVKNAAALEACAAPEFLAHPLPESWLDQGDGGEDEGEDDEEQADQFDKLVINVGSLAHSGPSSPTRGDRLASADKSRLGLPQPRSTLNAILR